MTTDAHCRIAKVRYKNAPNLAEILPKPEGTISIRQMHGFLDEIAAYFAGDDLAGMVIVGFGKDGWTFSRAVRLHPDSLVGPTLLPSFVSEILRRDIMRDEARDVVFGRI